MPNTAYLPGYGHDVFISYVHEEQLSGWTARLCDELGKALNYILVLRPPGQLVDVWIDEQLRKNLPLTSELKKRVEDSAFLLIVMSPFYLDSEWCKKEVGWFTETLRSRFAPNGRVFVVQVAATDRNIWPPDIKELPGYKFFASHPEVKLELPFGFIGDPHDEVEFKKALYNLAGQIKQQIDELIAAVHAQQSAAAAAVQKPPVAPPTTEKLVCLEFLGNPSTAAELEQLETEVRSILNGLNVDIFAPSTLGQVPRDPAGTDRYLQRLIKAKAQCDGLLVVRVDRTTSLADWRLDYVSDIRPAALRLRSDGTVPRPLIVDTSSPHADPVSEDIRSLRYDQPDFTAHLAKWVDSLPVAPRGAA